MRRTTGFSRRPLFFAGKGGLLCLFAGLRGIRDWFAWDSKANLGLVQRRAHFVSQGTCWTFGGFKAVRPKKVVAGGFRFVDRDTDTRRAALSRQGSLHP